MTGLTDALRERLSRRGRTAQADCGALGVLTVEALSPGDCAALLRGSGGKRAVLYAACRELQRAGEDLRQEGRVFTPEEIMEYVSDGELSAAVAAVLALSGVEDPGEGGAAEAAEPEALKETEPPEGTEPLPPSSLGEAAEPERTGAGEEAGPESHPEPLPAGPEAPPGEGKTRLETVQEFREGIPEIRQGFVRDGRAGAGPEPGDGLPSGRKIRPKFVRKRAGEAGPETDGAGQASRETGMPAAIFRPKALAGRKPQAFVSGAKNRAQNVAKAIGVSDFFRQETGRPGGALLAAAHETKSEFPEGPHEMKSEFPEGPHEIKSEFPPEDRGAAHETESEFVERAHETKSELPPEGGGAAHEIESEFVERAHETKSELPPEDGGTAHETESEFAERAHETKSELPPEGGGTAHETESEFAETAHETKSESAGTAEMTAALAERAAEFLLEGLRRAAGAR